MHVCPAEIAAVVSVIPFIGLGIAWARHWFLSEETND